MTARNESHNQQHGPGSETGQSASSAGGASAERVSGERISRERVSGERAASTVSSSHSLQSRASSIIACATMITLGAAALGWYYTNALSHRSQIRPEARGLVTVRDQSDAPLPPLGLIEAAGQPQGSSVPAIAAQPAFPEAARQRTGLADRPDDLDPLAAGVLPRIDGPDMSRATAPATRSPAETDLDRRLSGAAFAHQSEPAGVAPGVIQPLANATLEPTGSGAALPVVSSAAPSPSSLATGAEPGAAEEWATLLRPQVLPAARASVLPQRKFLLARGTFIDCTLETAIDSTLPGMTTCVTATDTFGADGDVVLLDRGTKLIGETHGQVQQGSARIFVLWNEARTPAGVAVRLDSPGADELGRAGLTGQVARHFWDRFGAALLVSTLDGAVEAAVQSASHGSGAIIYNPSAAEGVATEALKGTLNIPPTLRKRNGDRVQVFVARDLDFRPVYALRAVPAALR